MSQEIALKVQLEKLVQAVNKENLLLMGVKRIKEAINLAAESGDHAAVQEWLAVATPSIKELQEARSLAVHHRATVRAALKEERENEAQVEVQA